MIARWIIAPLAAIVSSPALAADTETRIFSVTVDGRPAGEFRLTIRTGDDGSENVSAVANIQMRSFLGGYHYSYRGSEVWSDGRLRQFESSSDDNGKKHVVHAVADGSRLRVTVDGAPQSARSDGWPTTYWRMPPSIKGGQPISVLDSDTGEEQSARVDSIGPQSLAIAGKAINCTRVAVTASVPAVLHYDGRGRLVAEETTEDGHRTILTLREIQH
jgi:hypothetical protein